MTTATATPTIDERIAQLAKESAALAISRTQAQQEADAYGLRIESLARRISTIQVATTALASLASVAHEQEWLDHLTAWRKTLCDELLTIKSPIRDRDTKERADRLTWSIRLIDFGLGVSTLGIVTLASSAIGPLMTAAGYATANPDLRGPNGWRGSLKEVEQRIKTLTRQRAEAQAALDAALLTDDERTTREAEGQAYRDALNRLRLKGNSDGTGYVVCDEYGDVRDLATLTPIEREAFERADAAYRQEQQATFERQMERG